MGSDKWWFQQMILIFSCSLTDPAINTGSKRTPDKSAKVLNEEAAGAFRIVEMRLFDAVEG
jgi:hypothetical protein